MAGLEAYQGRHKALGEVQSVTARARAASTPTAQVIPAEAKELGVKWEVEIVSNGEGGKLHWVGDRAAKKVVLWFHGGGFALSISRGSVIFWVQSQQKLAASGKNVVLAFLEYGKLLLRNTMCGNFASRITLKDWKNRLDSRNKVSHTVYPGHTGSEPHSQPGL